MIQCELDYYNILNVSRNATKEEILLSYRKLAVKLCPYRDIRHERDFGAIIQGDQMTHMSPIPLARQWEYINMACDILSNDLRRAIYDRFGEAGLLKGMSLPNGFFPPYQYHGDHMKVYHDVFGSFSPYANVIDSTLGVSLPLYNNSNYGIGVKSKNPPVFKCIALDLEDVYHGCVKLMQVWRQEILDGNEFRMEKRKRTLSLKIPAGVTAGTRFSFNEEGDQHPTKIPSDIIFIVEDKPHKTFKRINQHDLSYSQDINLCQALTGFHFNVITLDKRHLHISISDVVQPGFKKVIPGEGLPKCNDTDGMPLEQGLSKQFGDLIIEFRVKFPQYLTKDMKHLTRNYFAELRRLGEKGDTII
ncbi:dnaJ homolog subfamily B member 13 isoform X2 [Haematobia irritans]|uniref:dnaJ homolog subfamily B member 13 isoform X2 n=1 Tax=Haematobia irritans TaxID=7368 RepID=UPI003F4FF2B5